MSSDGAGCVLLCSCPKCEQRRVAERGTELNRSQNEEDAGLELDKTSFLVMGISADALNAADTIVKAGPSLSHLAFDLLHIQRFTAEGYEGLGVPFGTDAFAQNFVKDKCLTIIDDVDKLDRTASSTIRVSAFAGGRTPFPRPRGAWPFSGAAGNLSWRRATPGIAALFFAESAETRSPWCAPGTLLIQCRLHKTKKHTR